MQPRVSVIVPVYNAGKYLVQCLESLVNQTMDPEDLEIILVNDGSTDGSPETLRDYASRYDNIVLIEKTNGGYGQSMNRGLERATGEYIGIVEPDDYVDAHMFKDLYDEATTYAPRPQVVKSAYWRIMRDGKHSEYIYPSPHKGGIHPPSQPFSIDQCAEMLFYHPSIWSAIYLRSFLDEEDIRFKEIPGAGWSDNPFFIQTLLLAKRIVYLDRCYYFYREDMIDGSAALKDYTIPFDRWNEMQDFIEEQGITDPTILEAHTCRGFAYIIGGQKAVNAQEHEADLNARIENMYRRMDEATVLASDRISIPAKKRFLAVVDPDYKGKVRSGYFSRLPAQFADTLRNGGLGVAIFRVRAFFAKMR